MPAKKKPMQSHLAEAMASVGARRFAAVTATETGRRLLINETRAMSARQIATRLIRDAGDLINERILCGVQDFDDEKSDFRFDESRSAERMLCTVIENLTAARAIIVRERNKNGA